MADDIPSNADDESNKKETIRITLPPKQPGSSGIATKKGTSKIGISGITTGPLQAPPPPSIPPVAPTGTSAPSVPPPMTRPLGGPPSPPKPPPLGGKPTIPLRPASPAGSGVLPPSPSAGPGAPVSSRPAPKKETARISLPSAGPSAAGRPSAALPKATVKMQQTQPLSKAPAPAISQTLSVQTAAAQAAADDKSGLYLSLAACILTLAALVITYLAYAAAPLPSFVQGS